MLCWVRHEGYCVIVCVFFLAVVLFLFSCCGVPIVCLLKVIVVKVTLLFLYCGCFYCYYFGGGGGGGFSSGSICVFY